jgi:hypothetical protein
MSAPGLPKNILHAAEFPDKSKHVQNHGLNINARLTARKCGSPFLRFQIENREIRFEGGSLGAAIVRGSGSRAKIYYY